jgi:periplasmic divalent cation tolerance protein
LSSNGFLVVLSTCPDAAVAADLARALLEGGHAACVNVVPAVRSMYLWQGAVQADEEALMVIKTTRAQFTGLRDALVARHPYELPEVVAVGIEDGHRPYLDWLAHPDGQTPGTDADGTTRRP